MSALYIANIKAWVFLQVREELGAKATFEVSAEINAGTGVLKVKLAGRQAR